MSVREYNAVAQEALSQPTTGEQENEWEDDSPAAKAPNSPLVENYLRMFVQDILHGDEVHKAWLLEAVECFIEGRHIPEPRSKTPIPKPTTSEWTPEFVMLAREGCEVAGVDFDTKIADAHNAALAAEREKYHV